MKLVVQMDISDGPAHVPQIYKGNNVSRFILLLKFKTLQVKQKT